jgi:hypothetical protein
MPHRGHCTQGSAAHAADSTAGVRDRQTRLRIKYILRNNENALKTQMWCAVAAHLRIAIVEKELQLQASLCIGPQISSVPVFERIEISCTFRAYGPQLTDSTPPTR